MKILYSLLLAAFLGLNMVYAQEAHHQMTMGREAPSPEDVGICPVTQQPALKDYAYLHGGKTYYFCCAGCIEEFKKDPQKYISKIKEIKLEAFRFGFSPDPLVVKKGDIVRLAISSSDVTHGVYIKEYNINITVKKGEDKKIEFLADKEGVFDILCSVYCGPGHSGMKGKLIIEK